MGVRAIRGYVRSMFDELKGAVESAVADADPGAVSNAARAQVGDMPAAEVAQHAHQATTTLQQQGQPDLAKELADVVQAAQNDPGSLKNGVIGFIEHHPQALAAFAPPFAQGILEKI